MVILSDLGEWLRTIFATKPKRLEMRFVNYTEGDRLIREEGWQLALPEEDSNRILGMVYVERVEKI